MAAGQPPVVVAGAGIGGLTAALALHQAGLGALVLESARTLRPLGVGINLLPQAVGELAALGLADRLAAQAVATTEIVYADEQGRTLFTEERGLAGGYRWPQYSVHRGRLQMLLLDAVRERLGPDAVRTGARVAGFRQDADSVRVLVGGAEPAASVLVGADGLHSAVRAALHPGPDPLLWSGVRMWRGMAPVGPFRGGRTMAIIRDAAGTELVVYPVSPTEVNWVALVQVAGPGPLPGGADWNRPGRAEDVLRRVAGWRVGWLDVAGLVAASDPVLEYPMVDRDPLPRWGRGRVTLLGDAAHPMYPVGANGGSQAIVDARVLAAELARDRSAGLAGYERRRRGATAAVVAANREMQRTGPVRSGRELARITGTYRRATRADEPGVSHGGQVPRESS